MKSERSCSAHVQRYGDRGFVDVPTRILPGDSEPRDTTVASLMGLAAKFSVLELTGDLTPFCRRKYFLRFDKPAPSMMAKM